jgi:hypothetical protein
MEYPNSNVKGISGSSQDEAKSEKIVLSSNPFPGITSKWPVEKN